MILGLHRIGIKLINRRYLLSALIKHFIFIILSGRHSYNRPTLLVMLLKYLVYKFNWLHELAKTSKIGHKCYPQNVHTCTRTLSTLISACEFTPKTFITNSGGDCCPIHITISVPSSTMSVKYTQKSNN